MSNTDELIRSVLESKKLSGEKVYGDQPLIFTASKMKSYTPPEYTEMRKLALQRKYIFAPAAEIFYFQAKFMEISPMILNITVSFSVPSLPTAK